MDSNTEWRIEANDNWVCVLIHIPCETKIRTVQIPPNGVKEKIVNPHCVSCGRKVPKEIAMQMTLLRGW